MLMGNILVVGVVCVHTMSESEHGILHVTVIPTNHDNVATPDKPTTVENTND